MALPKNTAKSDAENDFGLQNQQQVDDVKKLYGLLAKAKNQKDYKALIDEHLDNDNLLELLLDNEPKMGILISARINPVVYMMLLRILNSTDNDLRKLLEREIPNLYTNNCKQITVNAYLSTLNKASALSYLRTSLHRNPKMENFNASEL